MHTALAYLSKHDGLYFACTHSELGCCGIKDFLSQIDGRLSKCVLLLLYQDLFNIKKINPTETRGKEETKLKRRERQEHSKDLIHVGRRREDSVFISYPTEAFHLDGFNTRDKCFDIFNVFFNDRNLIHENWPG
jgi:hypothetical protein